MEINQAKPNDLIEILYLLRVCIDDTNAKGLKHCNSDFPGIEIIQSDLEHGFIYLAKDKGVCKGMVTFNDHEPEEYKSLVFSTEKQKPLYLQNIAVHPKWRGMGIAMKLIDFAQKFARENGFDCIRLDVFNPSDRARQLCEMQLFREVASFHSAGQKVPYVCYEKKL
jgi:ribosomal protein S18 acetylase RimI-like enzyme